MSEVITAPQVRRSRAAIGLALLVLGFPALGVGARALREDTLEGAVLATLIKDWIVVLALIGLTLMLERRSLASMGFRRPTWKQMAWGFVVFLAGGLVFTLGRSLLASLSTGTTEEGVRTLADLSLAIRIGIVLTAGIAEEIIFRGYLIERLNDVIGRLWLAATLSWAIFVWGHLPFWGVGGTLQIGLGGILITVLYAKTRSIWPCAFAHVLNHIVAFLVIPAVAL